MSHLGLRFETGSPWRMSHPGFYGSNRWLGKMSQPGLWFETGSPGEDVTPWVYGS